MTMTESDSPVKHSGSAVANKVRIVGQTVFAGTLDDGLKACYLEGARPDSTIGESVPGGIGGPAVPGRVKTIRIGGMTMNVSNRLFVGLAAALAVVVLGGLHPAAAEEEDVAIASDDGAISVRYDVKDGSFSASRGGSSRCGGASTPC